MTWGLRIQTERNPALTATVPRFETAEEVRRYGRYLKRQPSLRVLAVEPFETSGSINAAYPKGARMWKWVRDEV